MTRDSLRRYYWFNYHRRSHSQDADPGKERWVQTRRAEHLVAFVRRHLPNFRRHLDVGCSSGTLLEVFHQAFGSEGFGVEPSIPERNEALARGLHVVSSMDEVPQELAGTFDLVTLSHVLEHLPDPIATLRRIRQEWLTSSGLVLVETPNLFGHPCFELGHLTAYSEGVLRSALGRSGFETLELRRHGKPYSRFFPLFLLALGRTAQSTAGFTLRAPHRQWVRLRRWMGLTSLTAVRLAGRMLLGRRKLQPWAD